MGGDHPCPVCKATFTRPQHVARHMRSHTGDRPYKCQQCGDQFARSDLLSRHVNKCHSNNPQPPGRKGAAAQELDDKRRACDQCNHSKVRCDFGIPCGKCIQRKTICTYAKPPKKAMGKKGDFPDPSGTSVASSIYDIPGNGMPGMVAGGVPLHYIHPTGTMASEYNLQPPNVPLYGTMGNDFMHMQAPRNMYDSPSPNAPSLTMSVSTLESAGSSPDTQNLSASPNGISMKTRPRSLTVPTQVYQYPQQMYPGTNLPVENGTNTNVGRPTNGPMSAYPNMGSGLTNDNVNALSHSISIPTDWPTLQSDNTALVNNMDGTQHTRNSSVASSLGTGSMSNWSGSAGSVAPSSGMMFPLANDPSLRASLNNGMYPTLDMNFSTDDYNRPPTAVSDGGFATALDGLTLQDPEMYGNANGLYQQYMNNSMPTALPTMPPTENLPTGQTPDLWAAFMSEPFGGETPTVEKTQQLNGQGVPTPTQLKGFRPQLLTRLSKSSSMPNLVPLGTPHGAVPQQGQDVQGSAQHSRTPGEAGKPVIPPVAADAEPFKAYQQACLARQTPALKLFPKTRTGRIPVLENHSPHLATTLGIQAPSPVRGRPISGAPSQPISGRTQAVSQPPPQQGSKTGYAYGQQPPRPGSNLRPPGMAAFPTLSPQTRFLSQSLLAQNMQQEQQSRPSNKRLPSTTLGPDNAKRTLFHNLGQEATGDEHEYALFDDENAEFFHVEGADDNQGRSRRQSAPSISPPTVRSSSPSSASELAEQSPAPTVRQRVISDGTRYAQRVPQLVNHVQ